MLITLAALALAIQAQAAVSPTDPQAAIVEKAMQRLSTGKPAEAIALLDPALAAYARRYADEKRQIYCGMSPAETLAYMATAAGDKTDAVAIEPGWCDALFVKGFALLDLHRVAEGTPFLEQAVAKAPMHAHFLSELGYAYQQARDWQRSHDTYARADAAAALSDKGRADIERARARRGMGFALIELGRWDEAELAYRESVALDPSSPIAKRELEWIAEHRPKPTT